jgi:hypothetical protein
LACTFWTETDPVAPSVTNGAMRKKRRVKPDVPRRAGLVLREINRDRTEVQARTMQLVAAIGARAAAAGGRAVVGCRSANAAMWALAVPGVRFRTLNNDDGTIECWQQPKLPAWEVPKRDPHERRPPAPEWEQGAGARRTAFRSRSPVAHTADDIEQRASPTQRLASRPEMLKSMTVPTLMSH